MRWQRNITEANATAVPKVKADAEADDEAFATVSAQNPEVTSSSFFSRSHRALLVVFPHYSEIFHGEDIMNESGTGTRGGVRM